MGFLDGLRVLDCTDERGLLAGRLLADLGADVVQVEPPVGLGRPHGRRPWSGGSSLSGTPTRPTNAASPAISTPRRVADLEAWPRRGLPHSSRRPGVFDGLGLGWDTLRDLNPRLIYVPSLPSAATVRRPDWASTDLTVWAAGGPLAYNQDEVGPAAAHQRAADLPPRRGRRRGWRPAGSPRPPAEPARGQRVEVSAQASLGLCTLAAALTAATGDKEPDWIPRRGVGSTSIRAAADRAPAGPSGRSRRLCRAAPGHGAGRRRLHQQLLRLDARGRRLPGPGHRDVGLAELPT